MSIDEIIDGRLTLCFKRRCRKSMIPSYYSDSGAVRFFCASDDAGPGVQNE
jgi:hypothetical protein